MNDKKRKKYHFTRAELKKKRALDFKEGDWVLVGKYVIYIKFGNYTTPYLCSEVGLINEPFKRLDCTPGVTNGRPYYIEDFLLSTLTTPDHE